MVIVFLEGNFIKLTFNLNLLTFTAATSTTQRNKQSSTISKSTPAPCLKYEYLCPSDKKCIHTAWICDGEADCAGMEDESAEACDTKVCGINEFKCKNGMCTWECYKCDGIDHCGDKSDEENCSRFISLITCDIFQCRTHYCDFIFQAVTF